MPQVVEDAYLGEIRMFAGTYAPVGWAFCNGTVLSVTGNEALFSLIGSIYGGNERTTFALPDLRGRAPMHYGQGPGLNNYPLGMRAGSDEVTLTINQIPSHNHPMQGTTNSGTVNNPSSMVVAETSTGTTLYTTPTDPTTIKTMDPKGIVPAGASGSHDNVQPSQVVSFIIATQGIYPPRN